jgi:hypothetical protein
LSQHWLRADYAEKLRNFMLKNVEIKKILNFNEIEVFVGVGIGTVVFVFEKKRKISNSNKFIYLRPKSLENLEDKIENEGYSIYQKNLTKNSWIFYKPEIFEIKKYIDNFDQKIEKLNLNINRGILTGFNKAFVINEEIKNRLIKEDEKSKSLIKPILRRRDINRYYFDFTNNYLLFMKWDVKIDDYPAIKRYLGNFKEKLSKRPEVKENRYNWYCLSRYGSNYYTDFEKPKIMWQEMGEKFNLSLDKSRKYCLKSLYIMTGDHLDSLLLILNSNLYRNFLIPIYIQEMSGGKVYLFGRTYVEKLPIKIPKEKILYKRLCDFMMLLSKNKEVRVSRKELIKFLDKEIIDSVVYETYFENKLNSNLRERLLPIIEAYKDSKSEDNNLKAIENIIERIKNEKKILDEIDYIKNHNWIKIIEEQDI